MVLREYLVKRAQKEINQNKITALSAMLMASGPDAKRAQDAMSKAWSSYVESALFIEDLSYQQEQDLMEEYEYWKNVKPKVNIEKGGKNVSLSVSSLTPKSPRKRK